MAERNEYQVVEPIFPPKTMETGHCSVTRNASIEEKCANASLNKSNLDNKEELDDSDWEDGSVATDVRPMTIELNVTTDSTVPKRIRRASAQDKVKYYLLTIAQLV